MSIDPALVSNEQADETGIAIGSDDDAGHAYLERDRSGRYTPEEWGDIAVEECLAGAAGVVIETNHYGDGAAYTIKSRAELVRTERFPNGLQMRKLPKADRDKPVPQHTPGVIYVREVFSRSDKTARSSGPASESEAQHVHHVGKRERFAELERQLTTYIQGVGRSPNRLDAYTQLITELRNLAVETKRAPRLDAEGLERAQAVLRGGAAPTTLDHSNRAIVRDPRYSGRGRTI